MKGIESVRGYQEDIIESIPSTIIIVDRNLDILYANRNYYVKSGKKEKDTIGERLIRVFSQTPLERAGIEEKVKEVFRLGYPFDGGRLRYPGGLFFFYKIYPLRDDDGHIRKAVLLMEDITDLTRLEEELRDSYVKLENAYAELKEEDEVKSDFIQTVSHELRTPLTVMNSYIEMFEDGLLGELDENQKEKLQIIRSQTDSMIRLVEDMLDTSRLETRKFKIKKSNLNVGEIARDGIEEISRLAALKEHSLSLELEKNLPEIKGDRQRIKQVFGNLLTNAIKYSPAKGVIEVKIKNRKNDIIVSICDTGAGIAEKDQEKIFEKFYTGEGKALTGDAGRMGLGLTIAKGIVEAHGGNIWVKSKPGSGSTFYFTLPKYEKNSL
jgi:PAS domain S-box-containing protein